MQGTATEPFEIRAEKNMSLCDAKIILQGQVKMDPLTPLKTVHLATKNPGSRFVGSSEKSLARDLLSHIGDECRDILRLYQKRCMKQEPDASNMIFKDAKKLIKLFFGDLQAAKTMLIRMEQQSFEDNILDAKTLTHFKELSTLVQKKYETLSRDVQKKKTIDGILERNASYFSDCYVGRWLYRSKCEIKRDPGHVAAYYIFKVATLIAKVVKEIRAPTRRALQNQLDQFA